MRCMTDHRIQNNPLSSFKNKQRSFSNISYMVYFTIYRVINGFCQNSWHLGVDRDRRECKDRQLWVEIGSLYKYDSIILQFRLQIRCPHLVLCGFIDSLLMNFIDIFV